MTTVQLKFTKAFAELLESAAADNGVTTSEFVQHVVLASLRQAAFQQGNKEYRATLGGTK